MKKKYFIAIFVFLLTTVLYGKNYPVCKEYYLVAESESLQKQSFLEKILNEDPNNVECMLKLASVYFKTDKVSYAFDLIRKAYVLDSKFVEKQTTTAKVLDLALKLSRLREHATKKKDIEIWNELGYTYNKMRIFKEASNAYANSLTIDANQTEIQIKLALSYANADNAYKAMLELRSVTVREPEHFYANYYLGKVLKNEMKNPQDALKYLMYVEYLINEKKVKFDTPEELLFLKNDIRRELEDIKNNLS